MFLYMYLCLSRSLSTTATTAEAWPISWALAVRSPHLPLFVVNDPHCQLPRPLSAPTPEDLPLCYLRYLANSLQCKRVSPYYGGRYSSAGKSLTTCGLVLGHALMVYAINKAAASSANMG